MVVELISVGTEILLGNIVNTNATYLAEQCALLGCSLYRQSVVGDNEARLEEVVRQALGRADIIILTGGLGPTKDDLTKEIVAKVFGRELYLDEHTKERITTYMQKLGRSRITENNWKQAMIPEGAIILDNENGTAPGIILEDHENGKTAILMPGPPSEMHPMFEKDVAPYLNKQQPEGIYSRMVKICGIGESAAETMVADLMDKQSNPTLAPYAKTGEVHFRITAKARNQEEAEEMIAPMLSEMQKRFGKAIYTTEESVTLEDTIVDLLKQKHFTVTTAESCTAGKLAGRIMNVAGASEVYNEGYITYANAAKEKLLGVKHETLERFGAVSEETATEMAIGAAKEAGADVALSVTGIAGPGGGTPDKPVGLVYIGCYVQGRVYVKKCQFTGNRERNRDSSVVQALTLLREKLLDCQEAIDETVKL